MSIDYMLEQMSHHMDEEAVVSGSKKITYGEVLTGYTACKEWLAEAGVPHKTVVALEGDYCVEVISMFLALVDNRNIIVPLSSDSRTHHDYFVEVSEAEFTIRFESEKPKILKTGQTAVHQLYKRIHDRNNPGLVLFSSGTTGKPKGIVQDLGMLMEKFKIPRKPWRMLIFLQLDHIGGINSLLYSLFNGGTVIVAENRSPADVCKAIQNHRAELLPTSPTFLNLLLLSREYENYDLSSLKLITYGTEPMPQSTLNRLEEVFPGVKLQQTYGMSELGIMRSKSRDSKSLWMKIGGDEFKIKIVDNVLWVKAESSMLGYLNAPDPFDADGYLCTKDIVEQDGEWIRILGRDSELINVGGLKVFPAEVESTLLEMDNVEDAVVFSEPHPITGQIVAAQIRLQDMEDSRDFKIRMRRYCKERLQAYKIPSKVFITDKSMHNERFKRMRRLAV
jgi:long-chain acyl-CoA synthetase